MKPATRPDRQTLQRLEALLAAGHHAEAATVARQLTVQFPDFRGGWAALGAVLQRLGQHEAALPAVQRAAVLAPGQADAQLNVGHALRRLGRLDAAAASYRRALELRPGHAKALQGLGHVLRDLGRTEDAVASYRQALASDTSQGRLLLSIGNVLQELGEFDAAAAQYREAIRREPGWPAPLFNLHAVQLHLGDLAGALASLERAHALEPANLDFRFFLGLLLEHSGQAEQAAPHLAAAASGPARARAWHDAWQYLRAVRQAVAPVLTGTAVQAFELGLRAARRDGLVLEFGVRWGRSIRQIAALVDQEVHGFDSFEGLPEGWHGEPRGSYSTGGQMPRVPSRVTLHAGWFEHTLPAFLQQHAGAVRFVNIDCDLYTSTRTVLDALAPRIGPGTVIVFDEYIGNAHWRQDEFKAFQEAVAQHGWAYDYLAYSFATKQVVVRLRQA